MRRQRGRAGQGELGLGQQGFLPRERALQLRKADAVIRFLCHRGLLCFLELAGFAVSVLMLSGDCS